MTLDFSKATKTVSGKAVKILTAVCGGAYPIVGVFPDDQWAIGRWHADGRFYGQTYGGMDLATPVPEPRRAICTMVLVGYDDPQHPPQLLMYGRGKQPVIGGKFANGTILNSQVVTITEAL